MAELHLVRRMRVATAVLALLASALLIANGDNYAKWSWSRELPKEIPSGKPATNRATLAVDVIFARKTRASLDDVLAFLGQPDGFSRQSLYSRTKGTARPQTESGTVRFLLSDDAELLVGTGDFHIIYEAIRYDRRVKNASREMTIRLTMRWSQPA